MNVTITWEYECTRILHTKIIVFVTSFKKEAHKLYEHLYVKNAVLRGINAQCHTELHGAMGDHTEQLQGG